MPTLKQIVPQLRSAVVQVIVHGVDSGGKPFETIAGTGFFVSDHRYIATAAHVIKDSEVTLIQKGASNIHFSANLPTKDLNLPNLRALGGFFGAPLEVVDVDEDHDLALLRTPQQIGPKGIRPVLKVDGQEIQILEVSDARFFGGIPEVGDEIAVAGFPLATAYLIVQKGIISALPILPVPNTNKEHEDIVIDAAVNPGNSGGPVFIASNGLIVGVCRAQRLAPVVGPAGTGLSQNAGLSLITPAKFLRSLMEKHGIEARIR